jgi:hypothetical protein
MTIERMYKEYLEAKYIINLISPSLPKFNNIIIWKAVKLSAR